jgi:DNA-binding transcriptional regulator GbsR (MarR family)
MNVSIYPELIEAIPPIKNDVLNLEQKLKIEEKRLKWLNNRFEFLENKLDRILSKCNFGDQKCRRLLFLKNNPKYEKLKEQVDMQLNTVYQIKGDLSRRNSFLSDLQSFKKLIEKYVELPQVA